MHLFIFWGFLLLAIGTGLVAFQDDFLRLLFGVTFLHGDFYLIFTFILDLAGLAAIVGILMALIRRYVMKPDGWTTRGTTSSPSYGYLSILVTGFLVEGPASLSTGLPMRCASFVGWVTSSSSPACRKEASRTTHVIIYYFHMLISFGFIAYVVYSNRLLHIVTSSLNMMFRGVEDAPRGALAADSRFRDSRGVRHQPDRRFHVEADLRPRRMHALRQVPGQVPCLPEPETPLPEEAGPGPQRRMAASSQRRQRTKKASSTRSSRKRPSGPAPPASPAR